METTKTLFTTGEFADICGVKKQTFFHYDEIGLLKPEYRDHNGYRYYSIQQAEVFSVIEILKDIDMSLAEIKDFLQGKSPEELIELFITKEEELKQKIANMQQTRKIIQNKKEQIEEALQLDFDQLSIEEMEAEYYLLSNCILNSSDKAFTKHVMSFIKYTKQEELDIGYPIGGLVRKEQIELGDYWNYAHLYMRVDRRDLPETFIKTAGKYMVGYHQGSYLTITNTYKKMHDYLDRKGYHMSGYSFEEYIMDEISVSGEDNYVTKIMIQIEKNKPR